MLESGATRRADARNHGFLMTDSQETLHFLDYLRVLRARKEIIIAVALFVVITGIIITYSMPKVYRASCVIQVKEERPDLEVFSRQINRYNPLFLRTQFEIIQSRKVLEEAIRRTGLREKLAAAYNYASERPEKQIELTLKLLSRSMRVQQYRDTELIEIQIHLSEPRDVAPQMAAEVANEIADVFERQNQSRSQKMIGRALEALEVTHRDHKKKVVAQEDVVKKIREQYKIDDVTPYEGRGYTLGKQILVRMADLRVRALMDLAEKKARYDIIGELTSDQLSDAAWELTQNPALRDLRSQKRTLEVEMRGLRESLGEKHPRLTSAVAASQELDTKILDALNGLKIAVKADYDAVKAKYDALNLELEKAREKERLAAGVGLRAYKDATETLQHMRTILNALDVKQVEERIEREIPRSTVVKIDEAKPPDVEDPVSPNMPLNVILSILIGVGSGIGLAFFIEYLDTSVKTIEDIEKHIGVSVIGVIPQKVKPLSVAGVDGGHAEVYRVLRTNMQFSKNLKQANTICVTSGSVGEGKSLTLFNLAYVCAQLGDRVLVVDSDLHRPRQHKMFGVSNSVGLANVMVGEVSVEDAVVATDISNLDFLPSGRLTGGVYGLLDNRRLKEVIDELKQSYDMVFFDAPPIIGVSDTALLAREMDGVLLVIQHRKYPRAVSGRARDMLRHAGANLVGVVLNNINVSRDYSFYHHYYTYQGDRGGT